MPTPATRRATPPRAAFDFNVTTDHILIIQDLGNPRSVTNDMEQVLADITQAEGWTSLAGYRVIYADSEGDWAGVQLNEQGRFAGFYGLGRRVTDERTALVRVRELHPTL